MKKLILIALLFCIIGSLSAQKIQQQEVYELLLKHEVEHNMIVLKQAIHESASFKSRVCLQHYNLFGLVKDVVIRKRHGKKRRVYIYHDFESYEECVMFYKSWQDRRYKGGNYYTFLKRIGYAEDKKYITKLMKTPVNVKYPTIDKMDELPYIPSIGIKEIQTESYVDTCLIEKYEKDSL